MSGIRTAPHSSLRRPTAGSALLAVLWLSAALSAIAFSLAVTVRGETERSSAALESVRSHYLATGAIQRAMLYVQWGLYYKGPDGQSLYYTWGAPSLSFEFPTGSAQVLIAPESSKLNVNLAKPEELFSLLVALGAEPERAQAVTQGILEWRTPIPGALQEASEQLSFSPAPSFPPRHASLEEIEELLLVKGMTPDLFYGSFGRDGEGGLVPRIGLRDCLSTYGAGGALDVNTAQPAVLSAAGVSVEAIALILQRRNVAPFRNPEELAAMFPGAPFLNRLRVGGTAIFTLRATARLKLPSGALSEDRRSVAAVVKLVGQNNDEFFHVLRWYDNVWVQ
ncbi:MAG: general secretion pathway protein GspK [Bryobacteraceae bacterium]